MANIDPVASGTRTDQVQATMGQTGNAPMLSREALRRLSELSETNGVTRKEMLERLILQAR